MMEDEMPELRILRIAFVALVLALGSAGCALSLGNGSADAPAYRGSDPFAEDDSSSETLGGGDDDDDDDDDQAGFDSTDVSIVALDPCGRAE